MRFAGLRSRLQNIRSAFHRTRFFLGGKIHALFKKPLDDRVLEDLEQLLFEADFGTLLVSECIEQVKKFAKKHPQATSQDFIEVLREQTGKIFQLPPQIPQPSESLSGPPYLILMLGVNGSGKTTTVAKLAHLFLSQGKDVILAAGDTFRAAAIEQLSDWAQRLQVHCVKGKPRGDSGAVIFDALAAARARNVEIVIADTAGRLHTKSHLMEELGKMKRVAQKIVPEAPQEVYLTIDATTGQSDAIDQVQTFHSFLPLTGLILTKFDGSAKGGTLLSIYRQMHIPPLYLGTGEDIVDLRPFDSQTYIHSLFD